jgi:DNA-damage-inducible protein J
VLLQHWNRLHVGAVFCGPIVDVAHILLIRVVKEGELPANLIADSQTHDAWFRAKVREALSDTRPAIPHQQVMDEAQALIARKRRARS